MTLKFELTLLTPLWTQGVDANRLVVIDRIHETGLMGSLRWWYETVIRGLGGYACDPVDEQSRCAFNTEAYERARHNGQSGLAAAGAGLAQVCPACRLFGCTGWARKMRLEAQGGATKNQRLLLIIQELKPLEDVERWLLVKTMGLIADYGALGGRTPWKPQKSPTVGKDYGLVRLENLPQVPGNLSQARQWVTKHSPCGKRNHEKWPDLRYFFFVSGQYLERLDINQVLELDKHGKPVGSASAIARALRGSLGVSKKIFSFQAPGAQRLWGYGSSSELRDAIIARLIEVGIDRNKVKTGEEALNAF
jgi:CRISPR-associated protein Cmr1